MQPQVPLSATYKFNEATGWPEDVNGHVQKMLKQYTGQPLSYTQHAQDRAQKKMQLPIGQIPGLEGKFPDVSRGWRPVEVEHNGNAVTKLVMRGPLNDRDDAVMPIVFSGGIPHAKTAWPNSRNDQHKTLDLGRVHLPEEYEAGKPPRRRLFTDDEVKRPGYKPLPANLGQARQFIISRFGKPPKTAALAEIASSLPSFVNFEHLRQGLHMRGLYG